MAIIIPSKHIHNMQLDLIRDNGINRIDVGAYLTTKKKITNSQVFGTTVGVSGEQKSDDASEEYKSTQASAGGGYYIYPQAYAFADATIQYADFYLHIPRSTKNKYITKIYDGTDNVGKPQIDITNISGDKVTYSANRVVFFSAANTATPSFSSGAVNYIKQSEEIDTTWAYLTQNIEASTSETNSTITAKAEKTITPQNSIPLTSQEQGDEFVVRIRVAVGYSTTILNGSLISNLESGNYTATGEKVEYTAKTLEVLIDGDYYEFELEPTKVIIGEDNKKTYTVPDNELMQIENYYGVSYQNQLETAFSKTISQYKNGKETATIRCSISDYYDNTWAVISPTKTVYDVSGVELINLESGIEIKEPLPFDLIIEMSINSASQGQYDLQTVIYKGNTYSEYFALDDETIISATIINTEPSPKMTFGIYDEVIPMVYGADGQDHPMSLKQDGSPKVFQVLGTKVFYDGAVWQELSLQEV